MEHVALKACREEAGLSQSQAGERLGVPARTLQNWEIGHRSPPLDMLPRLAAAYGIAVGELAARMFPAAGKVH